MIFWHAPAISTPSIAFRVAKFLLDLALPVALAMFLHWSVVFAR